ncbi:S8 family serine peptidase [Microvirga makkahensis]|uniref:S8 family serine peptidase n=1 Tax=Microvirga makkahensis TaxID=1128670 RepID=A0A7X3MVA8_9HYPH|nr:S8 family serine peptidase [Microvirga makkahensis]MXQ13615.1 S8 family serine peptidase [Microvirga makkahensis]
MNIRSVFGNGVSAAAIAIGLASSVPAAQASDASQTKLPSLAGGEFKLRIVDGALPTPSLAAVSYHLLPNAEVLSLPSWTGTEEYNVSWYLDRINAADAYVMGLTGTGVTIAVMDTGLNVNHAEFARRLSRLSRSFFAGSDTFDLSDVQEDGSPAGHGTFVKSILAAAQNGKDIAGVAPGASLLVLRTSYEALQNGDPPTNHAIIYAAEQGAKVLNGSYTPMTFPKKYISDSSESPILTPNLKVLPHQYVQTYGLAEEFLAVSAGADADMVMVFAAGNEFLQQPNAAAHPYGIGLFPYTRPENHAKGIYSFLYSVGNYDDPSTCEFWDNTDPLLDWYDLSELQGALITVVATDENNKIVSDSNRCGVAALRCLAAHVALVQNTLAETPLALQAMTAKFTQRSPHRPMVTPRLSAIPCSGACSNP